MTRANGRVLSYQPGPVLDLTEAPYSVTIEVTMTLNFVTASKTQNKQLPCPALLSRHRLAASKDVFEKQTSIRERELSLFHIYAIKVGLCVLYRNGRQHWVFLDSFNANIYRVYQIR